jgi:hypothetical protein
VISYCARRGAGALAALAAMAAMISSGGPAQASAAPGAPAAAASAPYAQLVSVSCPGARHCVAVGYHTVGSGTPLYPLAEAWNGRSWRLLKISAIRAVLLGVVCPRRDRCIAVGSRENSDGIEATPLAATWNGRTWRFRQTAAIPGNFKVINLSAISCTSRRRCIAASGYGGGDPTLSAAVERWNGRRWHLRTVFDQSSLNGVSCLSVITCLAVGSTSPASDSWVPFAAANTTGQWQALPTPPGDTGDLSTSLYGVSCPAVSLCMAVGGGMLIDEWNGSAWNQLTTPGLGQLTGVSCVSTAICVAVGQDGQPQAAAQTWDGTAWRSVPTVHTTAPSSLAGVSCSGPVRCMAVGYRGTPFTRHTLAERWDGTTWRRIKTPAA